MTYPAKVFWDRAYNNNDHSGVTTAQGRLISKWNKYPLMEHAVNDSPYGNAGIKYYVLNPNPPVTISGSTLICIGTPKAFSATNWRSGYTWDKSSNLSLSSTTSSSITVSGTSNGAGWVRVMNGSTMLKQYDVWVGPPPFSFYTVGTEYPRIHQAAYYSVNSSNIPATVGTVTFDWWISLGSQGNHWSMWKYGAAMDVVFNTVGMYTIYVSATNACGTCAYPYEHGVSADYHRGGSTPVASPNPVDDVLYIDLDVMPANVGTQTGNLTYDIRLYNSQGVMVRKLSSQGGMEQFNVSNLPDGTYFLHIYDEVNSTPYTQRIIVKH